MTPTPPEPTPSLESALAPLLARPVPAGIDVLSFPALLLNEDEAEAVHDLAQAKDLPPRKIITMAIRLYQLEHAKIKNPELGKPLPIPQDPHAADAFALAKELGQSDFDSKPPVVFIREKLAGRSAPGVVITGADKRSDGERLNWQDMTAFDKTKMQFVLLLTEEDELRLKLWNPYRNIWEDQPPGMATPIKFMDCTALAAQPSHTPPTP